MSYFIPALAVSMGIFLSWASRLGGELAFHPVAEIDAFVAVKENK